MCWLTNEIFRTKKECKLCDARNQEPSSCLSFPTWWLIPWWHTSGSHCEVVAKNVTQLWMSLERHLNSSPHRRRTCSVLWCPHITRLVLFCGTHLNKGVYSLHSSWLNKMERVLETMTYGKAFSQLWVEFSFKKCVLGSRQRGLLNHRQGMMVNLKYRDDKNFKKTSIDLMAWRTLKRNRLGWGLLLCSEMPNCMKNTDAEMATSTISAWNS